MRRLVCFAGFCTLLLNGCGGGSSPTAPVTALLNGNVHVIPTGPPIAEASVTLQGRTTITAANGNFTFSDLAPGTTSVVLSKTGFRTANLTITLVAGENFHSLGMEPNP